jgi:hypothetical protein
MRHIDGLDGFRGPGVAWNIGHAAFLGAFILFGALSLAAKYAIASEPDWRKWLTNSAALLSLAGICLFIVVIVTDLFPQLERSIELPSPLKIVGPLAFQVGFVGLLILMATSRPRLISPYSPVLGGLAFLLIGSNLDLLVLAAPLLFFALRPLRAVTPSLHGRRAGSYAGGKRQ